MYFLKLTKNNDIAKHIEEINKIQDNLYENKFIAQQRSIFAGIATKSVLKMRSVF